MTRALGYVRVSTEEQAGSGLGLTDQRTALEREAERRGWTLEVFEDAGYSARTLNRPAITAALEELAAGAAEALIVAKLDRLSRSLTDFAGLMDTARQQGWAFVALDLGVDTTTAAGELVANVMAAVAQWERRVIGERTAAALAVKKAAGARLGRPREIDDDVLRRIVAERDAGRPLAAIAAGLNADGVPTARGGKRWYPSTVRSAIGSAELDAAAAALRDDDA